MASQPKHRIIEQPTLTVGAGEGDDMRQTPLFLGLTKPTKILGLPIGYFMSLAFVSVIPFILFDDWRWLGLFVAGYPPLWLIADRNPHLFQVLAVTGSQTPRTANRSLNGGDRYVS